MLDIPNTVNRGVLTARFRVIRNNRNPAILVEGGYLTNRSEAQRIMSAWFLDRLARKLYDGIVRYRGRAPRGTGGGGRSTAEDQSA
jgi:N-acetylmuramoyl-L-alanine amidase